MHIPTPYYVHSFGDRDSQCHAIQAADGRYVAFNLDRDTAQFIVDACNAKHSPAESPPTSEGSA